MVENKQRILSLGPHDDDVVRAGVDMEPMVAECDRYRKALEAIAAVENWVEDPRLPAQIAQDALEP